MYGCMPKRCDKNCGYVIFMMSGFYVNVQELMLPRPTLKHNLLDQDRVESLSELGILSIKCKDCDYYDNKFSGLY